MTRRRESSKTVKIPLSRKRDGEQRRARPHLSPDGLRMSGSNRRAYITYCRRRGIDERTIMRQSGHKTRSAFDRYNIVDDNDQRAAVRQYEAALSGHVLDTPRSEADSGKTKAPDFSRAFG